MDQPGTTKADTQRTLAFLKDLKAKLPQVERDIGRLQTAAKSSDLYRGRWPTETLERTVRPLTGADAEHGLESIAAWGRQVMARLESIHRRMEPPAAEDFDWLRTRLRELASLCDEERSDVEQAQQTSRRAVRLALEPTPAEGVRTRESAAPERPSARPRNPLSTLPPGANVDELLDSFTQQLVSDEDIVRLAGRSALVADDDADVRALFDKTLRKVGMTVRCVEDGQAALEALRENQPDVLITDIVMPRLDGWELLSRLRRDFSARHIPTIILSWKEDLLERVRDLKAGASGYMLKESDRKQILYTVARALLPRLTLERRLVEEDEVMGRVERVGVLPLLAIAMQLRPSCRVHVTEHWNFYEAHIVDGELVAVTRTATDGSFSSGPRALERLVGVATGRFAVVAPSPTIPKRQIDGGTWNAIDLAAEKLSGLVSRLVEARIAGNAKVVIDDEEATAYGRILPPSLGALLTKLRGGQSLRDIVLESDVSPDVLETLLVDLVRAGVVVDVQNEAGATLPPPTPVVETTVPPRRSENTVTLNDDDLAELASPLPLVESVSPLPLIQPGTPNTADAARLEALEHKMRFYRGASVVLLVFCLSLAAALAISVQQANKRVHRPQPSSIIAPTHLTAPQLPRHTTSAPAPSASPRPELDTPSRPVATTPPVQPQSGTAPTDATPRPSQPASPKSPAATSATPVERGTLSVSAPEGVTAEVLVDGTRVGTAPLDFELTVGLHEVRLILPHKSLLRMVSIKAGETKRLTAE